MGIIKSLNGKISVNELAAKGVKISLKDQLLKKADKPKELITTTTTIKTVQNTNEGMENKVLSET